jgi:hypothetical protein
MSAGYERSTVEIMHLSAYHHQPGKQHAYGISCSILRG